MYSPQNNNKNTFSSVGFIGGGLLLVISALLILFYFKSNIAEFKTKLFEKKDPFAAQMVKIPGGVFRMGVEGGNSYEKPVHSVSVKDFEMGKYEVSQKQWQEIMGNNPSKFTECPQCPVDNVTWNQIDIFLKKLNEISHKKYRLPTEEEWEYAAQVNPKSDTVKVKLTDIAWFNDNSAERTHNVGSLAPNAIGLYDMSGNVWEWCSNWYDEKAYENQYKDDYQVPQVAKALRGGSWFSKSYECRISNRYFLAPTESNVNSGFRLAR